MMTKERDETNVVPAVLDDSVVRYPSMPLRLLYVAAIASAYPVTLVGLSGWVSLTLGTGTLLTLIILAAGVLLGLWRAYYVLRHRQTLATVSSGGDVAVLRAVAILLMIAGAAVALALLFQKYVVPFLFGDRSDNGIEFYVFHMFVVLIGSLGLKGVLLLEFSRLIAFERHQQNFDADGISETATHARFESHAVFWMYCAALGWMVFFTGWSLLSGKGSLLGARTSVWVVLPALVSMALYFYRVCVVLDNRRGFVYWPQHRILSGLRRVAVVLLPTCLASALLMWSVLAFRFSWTMNTVPILKTIISIIMILGLYAIHAAMLLDGSRLLGFERLLRNADNA